MSDNNTLQKPVVLTCAQPTGRLHLGNYLGAVKNWVDTQEGNECYFGIVDMHAMTIPYVPAELRKNTLDCAAQYIACGLDPKKCSIFIQSHVIGHTELAWVLGCITPLGQLERMTQFKDKARKQESVNTGLLTYPILMAADILIYNANFVPVGEDQKQHLELSRDLAEKFNYIYSETFNIPEPSIGKTGARIMSLQNPEAKMSKSDANQNSTIYITEEAGSIRKKIMSAVTDSGSEIIARDDKAGVSNLLSMMSIATGKTISELEKEFSESGYGHFKTAVADSVIAMLEPVRKRYLDLLNDKAYLESVLKEGAESAQKKAYKTLSKVYRKVGFYDRIR